MGRVCVVTDSTADFPTREGAGRDMTVVPLTVNWEGASYRDRVDLSPAEFYRLLRDRTTLPTTSAPSVGAYIDTFRTLLQTHAGVVCVTLNSKTSATHDVAQQAASEVDPQRVRVVDSRSLSMPLAWMAEEARRLGETGRSLAEIVIALEDMRPRLSLYFTVDTLEYFRRGGRLGRAQALLGTVLQLKPLLEIYDGEVLPIGRARSRRGSLERLVEIVAGLGPLERLGIVQGAAEAEVPILAAMVRARLGTLPIDVGDLAPTLGVHAGPGMIGFAVQTQGRIPRAAARAG